MGDGTVLRGLALFACCSAEDLSFVLAGSEEIDVEPDELVVRKGRLDHELYVILAGEAAVIRDGSEPASLGPGDFFGEAALLSGRPRNASVQASSDMRLLVLPETVFRELFGRVPGFAAAIRGGTDGRVNDLVSGS